MNEKVPGEPPTPDTTPLTPFQLEVSSAFFDLPESRGFLLAGGAALVAQTSSTGQPETWTSSRR